MSTKITLEYYGFPGEGPTVKAARADAASKLERYLSAARYCGGPIVISHPKVSWRFLLWLEPDGYTYRGLDEAKPFSPMMGCSVLHTYDRREAISRCASHLASLSEDIAVVKEIINAAVLPDERASVLQNWRRNAAFQLAYKAAPAELTDVGARHSWACHHDHEFRNQVPE